MKKNITRRNFVKQSALGAGAVGLGPVRIKNEVQGLPGEVVLAAFCNDGLKTDTSSEMAELVEEKLQPLLSSKPDIICLPEMFPYMGQVKENLSSDEQVEHSTSVLDRFSKIARQNNTYIICPVATQKNGRNYNSAVLLDRSGNVVGIYRKIHPTIDEMKAGFFPGESDPPVFKTDFGTIGIQICFDMRWDDGWNKLKGKGAEIIFWPSAFPGGRLINAMALQHQVVLVSSTLKNPARICDINGEELSKTGRWQKNWTCSTVNLEKVGLHAWPYVKKFDDILKKYGPKIHIHYLHEEGHAVIESRSEDILVKDILEEFEIKIFTEHINTADKAQKQVQKSGIESL